MTRRAGTVFLVLLAAALGVWGLQQSNARAAAERELSARYQQAFFEALEHVENVEVLLSKGLIASSPEQVTRLFSDLRAHAAAAQVNLTQLPLFHGALMSTSKFLAQVADFGAQVARKAAAGEPPDGDAAEVMRRFREEAAALSAELHEIQKEAASGRMPWAELQRRARSELGGREARPATGFDRIEDRFEQLPVIQYDGPFSDHVLQRRPKGLTGEPVSERRAAEIALDFSPLEPKDELEAAAEQRVSGNIPGYRVVLRRRGDEKPLAVMDVSEKGGRVVWMLALRDVNEARLSLDEAKRRAEAFLRERGFGPMAATYASEAGNQAVIPFVPEVDGVLVYPDLVKVTVALDDGEITGFEALGYLMSHTEREIPEPALSAAEAKERIAPQLTVAGEPRLAIIPLDTLEEVFTWEVPATLGADRYLVYINALTGEEEHILRLVETGEGTVSM